MTLTLLVAQAPGDTLPIDSDESWDGDDLNESCAQVPRWLHADDYVPDTPGTNRATYLLIRNMRGDVQALATTDGRIIESYAYSLYGAVAGSTCTLVESSTLCAMDICLMLPQCTERVPAPGQRPVVTSHGNTALWAGVHRDLETGWDWMGARVYLPELRQFLSRDPAGYSVSFDEWAYAPGDPWNYLDRSGWSPKPHGNAWQERHAKPGARGKQAIVNCDSGIGDSDSCGRQNGRHAVRLTPDADGGFPEFCVGEGCPAGPTDRAERMAADAARDSRAAVLDRQEEVERLRQAGAGSLQANLDLILMMVGLRPGARLDAGIDSSADILGSQSRTAITLVEQRTELARLLNQRRNVLDNWMDRALEINSRWTDSATGDFFRLREGYGIARFETATGSIARQSFDDAADFYVGSTPYSLKGPFLTNDLGTNPYIGPNAIAGLADSIAQVPSVTNVVVDLLGLDATSAETIVTELVVRFPSHNFIFLR